jgi:peptide/nickel transport system permease protein
MKSDLARYIGRRLVQMIPTLLGVILVTFILFNVVGGSPATQVLGKSAGVRDLDDYDRQRGFDRPLFWGAWAKTRLFNSGQWGKIASGLWRGEGLEWGEREDGFPLKVRRQVVLPLAFDPVPGTRYRWEIDGQLTPGATAELVCLEGGREIGRQNFPEGAGRVRLDFTTPPESRSMSFEIRVSSGMVELKMPILRRALPHPWDSQLYYYLAHLVRLDFGESVSTHQKVSRLLLDGLGPSLALAIPIFLISLTVSVALALLCAYTRDRWPDRVIVVTAVALMSINYLVWIVLGQYGPAYRWGWFPIWGFESWRNLVLPVWIGVLSGLGTHVRFYRTVMLDEIHRDYVRTAFAKGLNERQVLFGHVLKNAAVPIITNAVMAIPFLYTGNLLLESFFGIPGLGGISVNAINSSDFDVIRAVVLIGAVLYVTANLVADLCYAWVDPRVRLG